MSVRFSSQSAIRSLPQTLDMQMLCDAQACLRCLQAHQTPSAAQLQAFHCLHATYDPVIRSFVIASGVPADDADDCNQEVWKDLYIKLASFHSDGGQACFCSWLKSIAHSKATNSLRYQARHPSKRLGPQAQAALACRDGGSVNAYERQSLQRRSKESWSCFATKYLQRVIACSGCARSKSVV